ncbi:52 kDa repressor of the inhibitor of the protein kinase-like [Aphis craccivora]|uniref:52 kDa repressor of the inhibitor of the protein kinase-like n=1 Tax=Aphis craccivora TaxID=307492 RepID=A0A6G0YQ63_APHCR|nr:52 kDa repressor of the inhibitor of the protein kinase-like [Aphis craccivora]
MGNRQTIRKIGTSSGISKWGRRAQGPYTPWAVFTNIVPNIKLLLKIFTTLPVTTAIPKHTSSILKQLKTYLRLTIIENRLGAILTMSGSVG